MASVFVSCARSSHLLINTPLFRVVWMCFNCFNYSIEGAARPCAFLTAVGWWDAAAPRLLPFTPRWQNIQSSCLSISSLDCHLHNACEWPRGDVGGPVPAPSGCPVPNTFLLAAEELLGALQLLEELCPRAGSLMKKRWLGSCWSDVVMALVLRWFHHWSLEAWGFHCLLCLSSWNLWEKHRFGELFRIIAPSLFYHLHVCAAVTLIWCATWIT